jgi:hypothetical protein
MKMEQVERDNESIFTPDATDIVSDPDTNSGAQVGVEKCTGGSGGLCLLVLHRILSGWNTRGNRAS